MNDLKSQTVLFLTRDAATEQDRAAAKLLAQCDVELRHATPDDSREPEADVLLHGSPDIIRTIKSVSNAAGRIENALREASDSRVRHLQWVEESRNQGPKSGSGIGDGTSGRNAAQRAESGEPPKYHREIPDDLKRDQAHENRQPGTVN